MAKRQVVSIEASTLAATTLVLRIGPAPSAVPRTFHITLQLAGRGKLEP